jgi:hypothetical protein
MMSMVGNTPVMNRTNGKRNIFLKMFNYLLSNPNLFSFLNV